MTKFGDFDKSNKEYVISRPDTPLPWINYLGSEEYCALISNTAGGYSFYKDPLQRRILRYRYNNVPYDRGGRYLYIRDNKSKDFWSASWQPTMKDLKKYKYECRHGLGYTKITSVYDNIKSTATYFVPLGENLEIWMLEVESLDRKTRNLSAFSLAEFCLWDALNDMTDYQYNLNIGETDYKDNVIYHLTRYRVEHSFFAYFAVANQAIDGFESSRDSFLGPYGDFSNPRTVREGKSTGSISCGWAPVGSHQVNFTLKPKGSKNLIFILGYNDNKKDLKRILNKFNTKQKVLAELEKLKEYWEGGLAKFSAQTEDEDMNLMVNIWNQYQCRTTFNWSRSASYYESGIGRGMGYRDSNQDTLGFVHQIPEKVKDRIIDLLSAQFVAGNAFHQYSPLTKKGYGSGLTDIGYSDDHLWLILSVSSYIKETGDMEFLEEMVPYENKQKATVYEHLEKAIDFTLSNLGPHGLPLMFFADWNDCLNLPGSKAKAESVMVAQMLVAVAKEMARLAYYSDRKADVKKYEKIADEMTKTINREAWDGQWYIRAFTDAGVPVGSSKNDEGKIYLETQAWAVISGVADEDRAKKCMDSVKKHLASKYGIMLVQPSYQEYRADIGSVTFYPPGLKENGAIFCHPNPWAMIAETLIGRGNRAFDYYKAIMPAAQNEIADTRRVEPYIYCQMVAGKDHKDFGEGKNSWLTGSACWNFIAAAQWILGIRADYEGLIVDPCIPKEWKGFEVKRHFRGVDYYITIRNPNNVSRGVKCITIDGRKLQGNVIPPQTMVAGKQAGKKEHHIEVILG